MRLKIKPQNYLLYWYSCDGKKITALWYILTQHWLLFAHTRKLVFQTQRTGMLVSITALSGMKIGYFKKKVLTSQDCLTRSGRLCSSIPSLLHCERHQTQRGTRVAEVDAAEQRKDYLSFSNRIC